MDQPIVNILGNLVALGPIRRDLIPLYQRWINQFDMLRTLAVPPLPMTLDAETSWFDAMAESTATVMFTIYEREGWQPVGNVSLADIDFRNGTAVFGIAIGEASARGKGYGTEATMLALDYAFTALGLHNVMLTVFEYNVAGIRTYQKVGFREMGRRRQGRFMGGRFWDEIYMDCLSSEFESPVLAKIFAPDEPKG